MSDVEGEVAPELEVDDADLLEQATPVPSDDDDEYPFGPEDAGEDAGQHPEAYDQESEESDDEA